LVKIFASDRESGLYFNDLAGVIPANIRINFTSPETKMIFISDTEDRVHDRIFIRLDKTPERDRRTDVAITDVPWLL